MEPTEQTAEKSSRTINIIAALLAAALIVGGALWYVGALPLGPARTPALEREVTFPENFPEEGKLILLKNVETLRGELKTDPTNSTAWLDLAIQYKTAGDFDGAVEIWKYLGAVNPQSAVAYYNLGTTYHLDLREYAKAEEYLRKAIDTEPKSALPYLALHELYRYSYKQNTPSAAEVLLEGVEAVGEDRSAIDLYGTLASYYAEKGEKEKAVEAYEEAIRRAQEAGNASLAAQLRAEQQELQK